MGMNKLFKVDSIGTVISVGGKDADIAGFDSHAIQLAADAARSAGGGTIELSEGVFMIFGPVRLYSNTCLKGRGGRTILRKADGARSTFADDVDYGVKSVKVTDPSGFAAGMGILITDNASPSGWNTSTSKITKVSGDTLWFDRLTTMDCRMDNGGVVSTASSMIEAIKVENVTVSDLTLDGNKDKNFMMDGCRGGAVYFHKATNCTLRNAVIKDYNGDGVSWQITEDITLENVEIAGCTNFGMHPGTGSIHTVVRNCRAHHNKVFGLFVCWRVQQSEFNGNQFYENGSSGICIGHKDSGNLFEGNHIHSNGKAGVLVRQENPWNAPDDNTYRANIIEDNGVGRQGSGFYFECAVKGNIIEGNTIRNTGKGCQAAGILSPTGFTGITVRDNLMSGHTIGDTGTDCLTD